LGTTEITFFLQVASELVLAAQIFLNFFESLCARDAFTRAR
jgi:hypothetical protein